MPIKGRTLYPFRWWYRATLDNSLPIPMSTGAQTFNAPETGEPQRPLQGPEAMIPYAAGYEGVRGTFFSLPVKRPGAPS